VVLVWCLGHRSFSGRGSVEMFDESGIFDFLPLAQTPDRSGQPGTVHVTSRVPWGMGSIVTRFHPARAPS
jgi:hypothetical protein